MPISAAHIGAQNGGFEPQRTNNWSMEIFGLDGGQNSTDIIVLSLVSASLPNESSDEIELMYGNEKVYVAGQATFDPIPLSVRDYVDQETRNILKAWRQQVYNAETGQVGLAAVYKKTAKLILHAPDDSSQRTWDLKGVWPQALNDGGTLDMGGSDSVLIEATLRFDKSVYVG